MYPIIPFVRTEQRSDIVISWIDRQQRHNDDPLIERAFYYTKNEQHGIYAGSAQLHPFAQQINHFASDLFLIVTAGQVTLRLSTGEDVVAQAQESLVIPRGATFHWLNTTGTAVWFVAYQPQQNPVEAAPQAPFKVDPNLELEAIDGPSAELITSAQRPEVQRNVVYLSADGKFSVGIWQATAYTRRLAAFGDYELMYPIAGAIEITNALGEARAFGAHEGFIVNRGVSNAWHSQGVVKKIYSKVSV